MTTEYMTRGLISELVNLTIFCQTNTLFSNVLEIINYEVGKSEVHLKIICLDQHFNVGYIYGHFRSLA
jgi:hypothetical protein